MLLQAKLEGETTRAEAADALKARLATVEAQASEAVKVGYSLGTLASLCVFVFISK